MKTSIILLLFSCGLYTFAQNNFEPGYYISENGNKTEGLIKNEDWKNNPLEFKFKTSPTSEVTTQKISNTREFSINDKLKYVRANIKIDQSSNNIALLSRQAAPEFVEQLVFLKLLATGEASLYSHVGKNLKNFFYSVSGSPIEPLIYKKYILDETGTTEIKENRFYQQQFLNTMKCQAITPSSLERLTYSNRDLINFFEKYNTCKGNIGEDFSNTKKGLAIHLKVRPGLNFSNLEMSSQYETMNFGNQMNFRLGFEGEIMLPFNNQKWAFIIEPTYQKYEAEGFYREMAVEADYTSIELPIGIRHYLYLNSQSRFFVNAAYVLDFPIKNSIIRMETFSDMSIIDITSNLALGAGYSWKNFSAEARYHTGRNVMINYNSRSAKYETMSLILGYQLF